MVGRWSANEGVLLVPTANLDGKVLRMIAAARWARPNNAIRLSFEHAVNDKQNGSRALCNSSIARPLQGLAQHSKPIRARLRTLRPHQCQPRFAGKGKIPCYLR